MRQAEAERIKAESEASTHLTEDMRGLGSRVRKVVCCGFSEASWGSLGVLL